MVDNTHKVISSKLPFSPAKGQVIYVDPDNNKRINKFIVNNYTWIKDTFRKSGLDFCYLPLLGEELISYHAPYLNENQRHEILLNVPSMTGFIKRADGDSISISLMYAMSEESDGEIRLIPIVARRFARLKKVFSNLAKDIKKDLDSYYKTSQQESVVYEPDIRFSIREIIDEVGEQEPSSEDETNDNRSDSRRSPNIQFSIGPRIKEADETFDEQAKVLVEEIKERINALRGFGINTMFLHNIIDEGEHVSSLYITKDYRIILPDYDNMEIIIPDLPKAVFLLFLRHPEGIRFKDLADYREELINIYRALNPIGGTQRQQRSIRDLTNPLSNSINEKCAKIREAFVSKFDDRLAKNYYITGERGAPKRISLEPSLVVWE